MKTAWSYGILLGATLLAAVAQAQSILDKIEADIGSRAEDLRRAEELLANPDPNRRIAAMEALLASGDPALVQKAKETGLFADDPRLRAAALRAILDAGGPMRAEFTIPTDTSDVTDIQTWLQRFGGSWSEDRTRGYFGFVVGEYDEKEQCWKFQGGMGDGRCAFRMSGEEVMTGEGWSFNITGSAMMRLDDTGALTGAFLVNGRGTPVEIRIPLVI